MIQARYVVTSGGQRIPINDQPVDQVGAEERALSFTKRSIKKQSKLDALYAIIQMIDLTTLEGADTPARVRQMCAKAIQPVPRSLYAELQQDYKAPELPSVAAVCVYPTLVGTAVDALKGSLVQVASVATAFPSGQLPLNLKLADVKFAVDMGATEIDMVIPRGAFLSGQYQKVFDEIVATKEACGSAHLKVILETGELQTYDNVNLASRIAIMAGADFIKTSTGKVNPAATLPVTLVMLQVIKDHFEETGRKIGMKPAGGIRDTKTAIHYLCMVNEVLGEDWLNPDLFRFGASSLLNDVLRQIYKQYTGRYFYDDLFSMD